MLEVRGAVQGYANLYEQQLEDFVLELRESGASARGLADAVGVSPTTVHNWTKHARQRRNSR